MSEYDGFAEGDRVKIETYGYVTEVGTNYMTIETEDGDEIDVNYWWLVRKAD